MTVARSPLNTWLDELLTLVTADGEELWPSTVRKIKKRGLWRTMTPRQYYDAAQARISELRGKKNPSKEHAEPVVS
jgi:hypothetical protein